MSQEIKTMLIAISATLAALYVHHALERTQGNYSPPHRNVFLLLNQ